MVWNGTHFRNCILQTGLRQLLHLHLGVVEAKLVRLGFDLVGMLVHIAIHDFGYWLGMYLGWAEQGKLAACFGLCHAELSLSLGILLGPRFCLIQPIFLILYYRFLGSSMADIEQFCVPELNPFLDRVARNRKTRFSDLVGSRF
jgi:hypothetical protein